MNIGFLQYSLARKQLQSSMTNRALTYRYLDGRKDPQEGWYTIDARLRLRHARASDAARHTHPPHALAQDHCPVRESH